MTEFEEAMMARAAAQGDERAMRWLEDLDERTRAHKAEVEAALAEASRALDDVVRYFDGRMPPAGFPLASTVKPAADRVRAALDTAPAPQGEDHEAGIEAATQALRDHPLTAGGNGWGEADQAQFAIAAYLSCCPSSRPDAVLPRNAQA
jgi:ABC-type transporter Mla subunit MlaD